MEKRIIYNNRSFCLGTAKRYYFARINGKSASLHRYKYEIEKGPIPKGWHVHHKDENVFNNDINNLEALPPKEHAKKHLEALREKARKMQPIGIEYAKVWHGSDEGLAWHYKHYEEVKHKLHEEIERVCNFCAKIHKTTRKHGNSFCSNKCKSAWRRKNKPDKKMAVCPTCSREFETLKYLPNKFCSKECKPAPNPKGRPKQV